MKLYHSPTSPFVRKVMIVAIETGLDVEIEIIPTEVFSPNSKHSEINPLGKVPALALDDGLVLFDSPVICEYLDSLAGNPFFPMDDDERWLALRYQAMGDGIMQAALLVTLESRRPETERSAAWMERQKAAISRTLDCLEKEIDDFSEEMTIGGIAIGVALGYLDLRLSDDNWREGRPDLTDWHKFFSSRESVVSTAPKG